MTSLGSPDDGSADTRAELMHLLADLQSLVDAGLLVEVRAPGEPSRYALSDLGQRLAGQGSDEEPHHEFPLDLPEPCPACGARDGFDGGCRCRRCRIAWGPEM